MLEVIVPMRCWSWDAMHRWERGSSCASWRTWNRKRSLSRHWRVAEHGEDAYVPTGFIDMMFVDSVNFDRAHYDFGFVRNDFLGTVHTQVFWRRSIDICTDRPSQREHCPFRARPTVKAKPFTSQ
jgi:hypothetical protein